MRSAMSISRSTARRATTAWPSFRSGLYVSSRSAISAKRATRVIFAWKSTPESGPISLHNFYVPAGGDEPDVDINPKFQHKLDFLDEMRDWIVTEGVARGRVVLVGDLNVAPLEHDVWSHKALLKVVSHTPSRGREADRGACRRAHGSTPCAISFRRKKSFIRGGAIAPPIGRRRTGGAGLTIFW